MLIKNKIILDENDIPTQWYNIIPELPNPPQPPLNPATSKPLVPDDLAPIFPMELISQEISNESWIDIPEEILDIYKLWRPTPLHRATMLEKALKTPAKIYYKNESVSPAGSHKPNTSIPQAYYNKKTGVKRLTTETGAGQWGSALSLACSLFGLECTIYMVKVSYKQKPYRRSMMESWGGKVIASPSDKTQTGRNIINNDPESPGSLGIAIGEAVEDALSRNDTKYSLGSVLNHVILHQTIIGLETKKQMEISGDYPDIIIGCCGGGSNFAGLSFPFIHDTIKKKTIKELRTLAVEPTACPTLTRGMFAYDYGDSNKLTPLVPMHTLGHDFIPPGIHAGGLRYHGVSPLVSQLLNDKFIKAVAYHQLEVFEAALLFVKTEGIIPAPEAAHAIKAAIDEANKCTEEGKQKIILFGLSGHGHFDMGAYDAYLSGELKDYYLPDEDIQRALKTIDKLTPSSR
ncbi:MAG: tryptophan synthase beta subunit [Candidatus Scalindua rubra]|uniref:Tryptophan synthase beta chain n=1 Tax=Candidatus Scalindua rubra TaxID=1872076 RepID=A0A1E3XEU8_9BACT|nr:MAG: tryptophan synthase beta subunit [Candidatus Scalindua rubra]